MSQIKKIFKCSLNVQWQIMTNSHGSYMAFQFIQQLADLHPDIRATYVASVQQAVWSTGGALLGGLLGGRVGSVTGTLVGSVLGYLRSPNYKSVPEVIRGMSATERRELARNVVATCIQLGVDYMGTAVSTITPNKARTIIKLALEAMGYAVTT